MSPSLSSSRWEPIHERAPPKCWTYWKVVLPCSSLSWPHQDLRKPVFPLKCPSSPKGHPHNLKKPGLVYGKAQKSFSASSNIQKNPISKLPLLDGVNRVSSLGFRDGWPLEHRSSKRKYSWQLASAQVIVIVQRINTLPKINIAFSKWCLEHYLLFSGRHNNFRCEVEVSGLNPSPFECRE